MNTVDWQRSIYVVDVGITAMLMPCYNETTGEVGMVFQQIDLNAVMQSILNFE